MAANASTAVLLCKFHQTLHSVKPNVNSQGEKPDKGGKPGGLDAKPRPEILLRHRDTWSSGWGAGLSWHTTVIALLTFTKLLSIYSEMGVYFMIIPLFPESADRGSLSGTVQSAQSQPVAPPPVTTGDSRFTARTEFCYQWHSDSIPPG